MKGFLELFLAFNCRKKMDFVILFQCLEVFTQLRKLNIALIGKYIQGSCIEESLRQTQVFGNNVFDAVLNGTNYVRSMKDYLTLVSVIENGTIFCIT